MSGPVSTEDIAGTDQRAADKPIIEVIPSREAAVGDSIVRRALPTRLRRTVGAWCFLDHAPPGEVKVGDGMQIGPHPHIGLQTVTWLLAGEVVHRDSLGSEQPIRPGQLNLMTAGNGVVHAEQTPSGYRGQLHAVQLWVAQPDRTRHSGAAFEHHAELPRLDIGHGTATVLIGELAGASSPARRDTDHFGADLVLRPGTTAIPVNPHHEHAVVVLEGHASVASQPTESDALVYLGTGRAEIEIVTDITARLLLLGGTPFEARPLMWWNFVARTQDEITDAYRAWQAGDTRFGAVASDLDAIPSPPPPWVAHGEQFRR